MCARPQSSKVVQAIWLQSPNSHPPDAPASALCTELQMLRENTGLSDPRAEMPFSGPRSLMTRRRRSGSGTSVSQESVSERERSVTADSATPRTVAHQAPLSMGFSRQYWSGLLFPSSGDLLDSGTESASPALAGGFFTTEPPGKPEFHGISRLFLYRQHPSFLSHLFFYTPTSAKSTLLTSHLGS